MGDHAVADGEDAVDFEGLDGGEAFHGDADGDTCDDVDGGDDEAGDGVAFDEFHGTVHGAVELVFFFEGGAAFAGLVDVDDAGAHVGVDAHLFTGHGVEGEASGDFCDTFGAFGDDDELDDEDDEEDNGTDDEVAADDEFAEGVDDFAGVGVEEDHAGGGDVEGEAEEGGEEEHAGEGGEGEDAWDVHGDH